MDHLENLGVEAEGHLVDLVGVVDRLVDLVGAEEVHFVDLEGVEGAH